LIVRPVADNHGRSFWGRGEARCGWKLTFQRRFEVPLNASHFEGEILNFEGKPALARDAVTEAESSLAEADAKAMQKLSEERVKAAAELAETEQQLVKLADRFERLLVRAPSDGVVQELAPKSLGEVIRLGEMVARIVPGARELVAEARIDPKDSGHSCGCRRQRPPADY